MHVRRINWSENSFRWIFFALTIISFWCGTECEDESISSLRGHSVVLTCPMDVSSCGDLHSVKWFKGSDRIAVVSGNGEVVNIFSDYNSRISIDHSPHGPATRLHLKSVQVSDEGTYVCESTFLEPLETCKNLGAYSIDFKVLVPPSAILILDEEGNQLKNSTTLGPLREGHTLGGTCEVRGARPAPVVGWYRSGKRLTDTVTIDESNGLFLVKSTLSLVLSRQELASIIECRVETPALEHIVSNQLVLDLQVRPTKISLSGVKHHTVQGTKVLLQCQVFGARPAANVTWYNSTRALNPDHEPLSTISTKTYLQNDGTFETVSQLIFTATRYENGAAIRCEGDNIVMRDDLEKPIHETLVLEVMYPPVVTVKPDNITINETEDFLLFCEYEANPASLESVRWKQNGKVLRVGQMSRYEGGNPEQTALLVKNASRTDIGSYTCELSNAIGNDTSDNDISVDVQYVPTVELDMDPESPIIENNESNVTLYCNVAQGNPTQLLKVRWYLDGQLLKELPECMSATQQDANGDDDDLCGIDPSKMLLQNVGRDFLGNYSCEGLNAAGWGQRSHEEELIVYYEPGNATIMHHPHIPVKRKSVTLSCTVDDGGNPNATRYRWLRGDKSVMDVVTPMWTVDPVGLDSRTNFSCYAYNEGGEGNPATVQLDVHAPPAFIQKLPPYTGALFSTPGISLSCRVECVPRCNISWFKDGMGIEEFSERYYVKDSYLPADPSTGDFESTLSILHFNMSAWPDEKLDIFRDSANYSCVSSNNSVGGGVRSATYFGVEYPPENTTVSNVEISVEEGHQPQRILCSAKAYPEPTYEWRRLGNVIAKGNALIVNKAMQRSDSGPYTCISFNRHGNHSAETVLNVLYRPNCSISRREIEDEDTLVCTAYGNPEAVDFHWSLKTENDTIDAYNVRQDGIASYLILEDDVLVTRTYRCVANNSVGVGSICEVDVAEVRAKRHVLWWQRWDRMTLIILIASVFALLLAVIIVCIIIICICRKRRRQDKYHTDLSNSAAHSVLTAPSSPRSEARGSVLEDEGAQNPPEVPKSPPKWPLRPGVLVHIKGDTKQNLAASRSQTPSTGRPEVAPGTPSKSPELPLRNSTPKSDVERAEGVAPKAEEEPTDDGNDELITFTNSGFIERILRRLRWRREHRGVRQSPSILTQNSPSQSGVQKKAASLLRAAGWFGSGKSTASSLGLFDSRHRPSGIKYTDGVVTYRKAPQSVNQSEKREITEEEDAQKPTDSSRKRKKGSVSVHDKSSAAGDPLTLTEPGEYENLPFHGLQNAPNKPLGADDLADDLEYADVDFRSYGPINYKAASIYALVKKQKNGALKEVQ
ncbi:hemicentin-1 isoform X6 [Lutzomyia longipalpis]|uniref:hemicentin-1 isoform X6 n=1 Tax=Lutzomyia longipalpis TaxID=7200 RepID=UPI002483CCDF|nr:hemicentin-1 isoform X6 [Lutzomyia longipalpis]